MEHRVRTLLIGLDGAELDFIRELAATGELPNLKKMLEGGAAGKMRSTPAFISAAAWSSIITGRNPGKTRVFDWMNKRAGGGFVESIANSLYRESRAFWHEFGESIRAAVIHVPCTYPPEKLNGIMISGQGHPPVSDAKISYPENLFETFPEEHLPYVSEYVELEKARAKGLSVSDALKLFSDAEDRRTRLTIDLCKREKADFCMIVYTSTDQFGHSGDSGFKAKAEAYKNCDRNVGVLMSNLADEYTTTVIISDHGNVPIRKKLNFWKFFRDRGLIRTALGIDLYTAVPHSVCGSMIIKVRGRDRRGIVKPSDYEEVRNRVIDALESARDDSGDPIFSKIYKREEIYTGPYLEEAPDLNYELVDEHTQIVFTPAPANAPFIENYVPEKSLSDSIFAKNDTGIHNRYGIFIATGENIPRGKSLQGEISVYDVAPVILHSLGLAIPDDYDGKIPEGLFDTKYMADNPTRTKEADPDQKPPQPDEDQAYTEEEEEMIRKRLEDLGYI